MESTESILIFTGKESFTDVDEVTEVLLKSLQPNRYVFRELKEDQVLQSNDWRENCALLVIACTDDLSEQLVKSFKNYFNEGGHILSICSELDKHFIQEREDNPETNKVLALAYKRIPMHGVQGKYQYKRAEYQFLVHMRNLADVPIIAEYVSGSNDGGYTCLQIHLTMKYMETQAANEGCLTKLIESEAARINMLTDILTRLGLDTTGGVINNEITEVHIRSSQGQALLDKFLDSAAKQHSDKINNKTLTVEGIADFNLQAVTDDPLPGFDWPTYKNALTSRIMGNILLYQKISSTTMVTADPFIYCCPEDCGIVAMATMQLQGRGRGANKWVSPIGCMMMTILTKLTTASPLGEAIYAAVQGALLSRTSEWDKLHHISQPTIMNTIPAVAVARLVNSHFKQHVGDGQEHKEILVKWPNDIYHKDKKLGGILVDQRIQMEDGEIVMHTFTGIGVNVCNKKPTSCLNDIINEFNSVHDTNVPKFSVEYVAARVVSETEFLMDMFNKDPNSYLEEYLRYWMHSGDVVNVKLEGVQAEGATVVGLTKEGCIQVQQKDGDILEIWPDGNTYDVVKHVITQKTFLNN